MLFSSLTFLVFFLPIFLLVYVLLPIRFRNAFILLASLLFYFWGAPKFIFVLLASCGLDYWLSTNFEGTNRRWSLIVVLASNVGLLAYFKYANFFVDNISYLLGQTIGWVEVALPIGISFFTFQKISYAMDVYRGKSKKAESFGAYLTFILLFPQLIAGPIVRYNDVAVQLARDHRDSSWGDRAEGLIRFIIGLSKKILIADQLGRVLESPDLLPLEAYGTIGVWMLAILYSMQIYFDFSGYSDMAIGLGRVMGFTIPENFNFPYISKGITEFWKRWHMSLGTWMKDYLYIPLGGNKKSPGRVLLNLWVVFLISGLWHGASWNFVLWGAFHGFFLVVERLFLGNIIKLIPRGLSFLYSFVVVTVGWVIFSHEDLDTVGLMIQKMFVFQDGADVMMDARTTVVLILALVLSFYPVVVNRIVNGGFKYGTLLSVKNHYLVLILAVLASLYVLDLGELFSGSLTPFIYFRF